MAYVAYTPISPLDAWPLIEPSVVYGLARQGYDEARADADDDAIKNAVERALRYAAIETGAIEGLYTTSRGVTRAVATQAATWQADLAEAGPNARGHFEAQLAAFDCVLDLATRQPMTEVAVRSLHETVCAAQATYNVYTNHGVQPREFVRGTYKSEPNHVNLGDGTFHYYAPVEEVSPEMGRFVEQLNSQEFQDAPVPTQASYSHHALTQIHPFPDGNGRTARALASVFTYRVLGIPLVIFSDQQETYFDALHSADSGNPQDLVRFMEDRLADSLFLLARTLRAAESSATGAAARFKRLTLAHGGFSHLEVQAASQRFLDEIQSELNQSFADLDLGPSVSPSFRVIQNKQADFAGHAYHAPKKHLGITFNMSVTEPVGAAAETSPIVGIADDPDKRESFIAIDANRPSITPLFVRIEDLMPEMREIVRAHVTTWVAECLGHAVVDLERSMEGSLKSNNLT